MTDPVLSPTPRVRPWMRILLAVSLAANLLIVGVVVGTAWRFGGPGSDRSPPPTGVALIRALPIEDRRAVLTQMRAESPPRANARDEARLLADALRADPFDRDVLSVEVSRQTHARDSFQSVLLRVWLDHVASMEVKERADYAARLLEMSERDKNRKKKKRDN